MGIFDKAKDALNSDKGEQVSDSALDKGADFAKGKLGEDKADKIDSARDQLDERIGNQGPEGNQGAEGNQPEQDGQEQ